MFDAESWLRSVRSAVRWLQNEDAYAEAVRSRAAMPSRWMAVGTPSGGHSDRLAPVDALVDTQDARHAEMADVVAEAGVALAGMRHVGVMEQEAAIVMELSSLRSMPHDAVARTLGISQSTERRRYRYGVEWLSAHGLAAAKAGMGQAVMEWGA